MAEKGFMNMYLGRDSANELERLYSREVLCKEELQVTSVINATVLPDKNRLGGVIDEQGCFVWESAYKYGDINLWGGIYELDEKDVEYLDEKVIFIGQIQKHWGNFLYDCMARMWYVLEEMKLYRVVYCGVQTGEGFLSNQNEKYYEFLQLLNISEDRLLDIRRPVRFAEVLIPQLSVFPGEFFSKKFTDVFNRAIKNANMILSRDCYDRIYFTRRKMTACKELGEKGLEKIFEKSGFQIIAPEKLSVTEQIYLINHCKVFASIEGTTSHNIMFANEQVEHIILRKQNYINTRQVIFDRAKRIMPQYIDVFYEPFRKFPISHDAGPFWVGVTIYLRDWMQAREMKYSHSQWRDDVIDKLKNGFVYTLKCLYYKYWLKY